MSDYPVNELHEQAMELTDHAFLARGEKDEARAQKFFFEAYQLEVQAVRLFIETYDSEPTRSVLLRSAATLALDCGELREAEKLIATALLGNPPALIAKELRELSEQVNSRLLLPQPVT